MGGHRMTGASYDLAVILGGAIGLVAGVVLDLRASWDAYVAARRAAIPPTRTYARPAAVRTFPARPYDQYLGQARVCECGCEGPRGHSAYTGACLFCDCTEFRAQGGES